MLFRSLKIKILANSDIFPFCFQILISILIQSGSRLFGFIGAGATLGQLFGSLFAASFAWMGPCTYVFLGHSLHITMTSCLIFHGYNIIFPEFSSVLLLFSSLLMELAALSSKGICVDASHGSTELTSIGYVSVLGMSNKFLINFLLISALATYSI